jgi:hypothetical protein
MLQLIHEAIVVYSNVRIDKPVGRNKKRRQARVCSVRFCFKNRKGSCLDSFREIVSSFSDKTRDFQGRAQLVKNTDTGDIGLNYKSDKGNHGQTSVLGFLNLLLEVLSWGVVESEGVEASLALSPAKVTGSVVFAQCADSVDAEQVNKAHEGDNLPNSCVGGVADGRDGVGSDVLETGDSGESREDESKDCHLRDTSMNQFDFTVPFKSRKTGVVQEVKTVEVVSHQVSLGGKEAWVETNISWKTSVKGSRGVLKRKCLGGNSSSRLFIRKDHAGE